MKRLLLLISFLILLPSAEAAYLDLAWDPNEEADVAGYKVYYGTSSGDYTNSVDVGNRTNYRLDDLIDDVIYHIALTAYDRAGNESGFSGEVTGVGLPEEDADSPEEKAGASIGSDGGVDDSSGCFVSTALRQDTSFLE